MKQWWAMKALAHSLLLLLLLFTLITGQKITAVKLLRSHSFIHCERELRFQQAGVGENASMEQISRFAQVYGGRECSAHT